MSKKILFILLLFLPNLANAETVEIDGIWYNLLKKVKEAEVIANPDKYSGSVEIPSEVNYEGNKYIVTTINDGAFSYCYSLSSLTIPNSIIQIKGCAFSGSYQLNSVIIEDLTSWCKINFDKNYGSNNPLELAHHLFLGDKEITELVIPEDINEIRDCTFYGCSGITSVKFHENVKSIGVSAFANCIGIETLTKPNSVKEIGHGAFYNCSSLSSLTLPQSITSTGNYAFSSCSSLSSLIIPNGVESIGNYGFYGCINLCSISIPSTVTTIFEGAFNNCPEIMDVYCFAEKLPSIKEPYYFRDRTNIFTESHIESATLHVPESAINIYKNTEPWSEFGNFMTLDGETLQTPKCATPSISIENNIVKFNCDTEGVEFFSTISVPDAKNYNNDNLTLSYKYILYVYASKEGYENSDVATREIVIGNGLPSLFGDLNKDGKVDVADHVKLSDIIMNK